MNSVPTSMWEWLAPIEPDERFALCITSVVVGVTALVFIVGLVSHSLGKVHRVRLEHGLKRELLDRGLSSDEIAQIVESTAGPKGLRLKFQTRGTAQETEHACV